MVERKIAKSVTLMPSVVEAAYKVIEKENAKKGIELSFSQYVEQSLLAYLKK